MDVQYVSDAQGKPVSVIVPIEVWNSVKHNYNEFDQPQTTKKKPSDYRGSIPSEMADELREYTRKARSEWDRDIS